MQEGAGQEGCSVQRLLSEHQQVTVGTRLVPWPPPEENVGK